MSTPAYRAADLASRFGLELAGDADVVVRGVATLANAAPDTLAFLANPKYRSQLAETRAGVVVMRADDAQGFARTAELVCVSGGRPLIVMGEWSAEGMLPLTLFTEGSAIAL